MSTFDEDANLCELKLKAVNVVVCRLQQRRAELEMHLIAIVAKLQDFHETILKDEALDRAIPLLDEILSEFKR